MFGNNHEDEDLQLIIDQLQYLFHELGCCNYLTLYCSLRNFTSKDFNFQSSFCPDNNSTINGLFLVLILFQEVYPDLSITMMDSRVAKMAYDGKASSSSFSFSSPLPSPTHSVPRYEFMLKMSGMKIFQFSFQTFISNIIQYHIDEFNVLLSQSFSESRLLAQLSQKLVKLHQQEQQQQLMNNNSLHSQAIDSSSSSINIPEIPNALLSCSSSSTSTKELTMSPPPHEPTLFLSRSSSDTHFSLVYDIYFIEISILLHPETKRIQSWRMEIIDHHSF